MVFDPRKDERLSIIQAKAGMRGFFTIFILNLCLMVVRLLFFREDFPQVYDGILLLSTMGGALVFTVSLTRAGYSKTIRDENTRSRSNLHRARLGVIAGSIVFGAGLFASRSYLGTGTPMLWSDIVFTALAAVGWGAGMWYWYVRKSKMTEEE